MNKINEFQNIFRKTVAGKSFSVDINLLAKYGIRTEFMHLVNWNLFDLCHKISGMDFPTIGDELHAQIDWMTY